MSFSSASAETLYGAMSKAYRDNPDLLSARAGLRATDETVAIAKSGRRPTIAGEAKVTAQDTNGVDTSSAEISLSISQSIFDGFRTKNSILAAHARVLSGRQVLLSNEMDILISTVQSYLDVLLNQQITSIRSQNLDFLEEQLKASQTRLRVGEGTRTDVAQAEASLAAAKAQVFAAEAALKASSALYKQTVGVKPRGLRVPQIPKRVLPRSLNSALAIGLQKHPALVSANLSIDAAEYDVKVQESSVLPGVSLTGSISQNDSDVTTARIGAQLTIPIFTGGANAARIRQSKEVLGEQQIRLDSTRRQLEQLIINAWVNFESSKASITANDAQVKAAQLALSGVLEERKVGQRTTLDVLNAQASVLNARESLSRARANYVVAAYNVLYSTGLLTVDDLGLRVKRYKPEVHFEAVEDKWFGLRTVTE
ncbi:MAG: TolC family outer membrane protein [Rhizobiaceae bacterium]|nr:TolC family outer membrane protein [Rhizobiaceae bacterium]